MLKRSQEEVFGENGKEEGEKEKEEDDEEEGEGGERKERVFVVKSPTHAKQMENGLEKRLKNAEEKLRALTPPRGRGKRQMTDN
ncbi:hypothetical protein QUF80_22585 [Desulfococcaceae bacterium HSG8]|nr:hypothetical protein [Desulfococcaceae bacterium HSG8]